MCVRERERERERKKAAASTVEGDASVRSTHAPPTSMCFFQERPDRGAMRPYVPSGTAIFSPVLTMPLPPAGIVVATAAERSNPALCTLPRTGSTAFGSTRTMRSDMMKIQTKNK